jgi:hypothetical protein
MERITFSIPDDLKGKLDARPDINWPEVLKEGVRKRLDSLEALSARGEL